MIAIRRADGNYYWGTVDRVPKWGSAAQAALFKSGEEAAPRVEGLREEGHEVHTIQGGFRPVRVHLNHVGKLPPRIAYDPEAE